MTDTSNSASHAKPPYLLAALLCDDVLEEKDGRLSILRLATGVNVAAQGANVPETMPADVPIRITAVVTLTAGGMPGTYDLQLNVIDPNGNERPGPHNPVELRHDSYTMNTIAKLQISTKGAGVYWIVVLLDGREVTRMPLTVNYTWKRIEETNSDVPSEQNPTQTTH